MGHTLLYFYEGFTGELKYFLPFCDFCFYSWSCPLTFLISQKSGLSVSFFWFICVFCHCFWCWISGRRFLNKGLKSSPVFSVSFRSLLRSWIPWKVVSQEYSLRKASLLSPLPSGLSSLPWRSLLNGPLSVLSEIGYAHTSTYVCKVDGNRG